MFLVGSRSDVALIFGMDSPLERAHVAIFSLLMQIEENNFLPSISVADWNKLQARMMMMTTGTDMKLHLDMCSRFELCREPIEALAATALDASV
jgi:hypothetical protein